MKSYNKNTIEFHLNETDITYLIEELTRLGLDHGIITSGYTKAVQEYPYLMELLDHLKAQKEELCF